MEVQIDIFRIGNFNIASPSDVFGPFRLPAQLSYLLHSFQAIVNVSFVVMSGAFIDQVAVFE